MNGIRLGDFLTVNKNYQIPIPITLGILYIV